MTMSHSTALRLPPLQLLLLLRLHLLQHLKLPYAHPPGKLESGWSLKSPVKCCVTARMSTCGQERAACVGVWAGADARRDNCIHKPPRPVPQPQTTPWAASRRHLPTLYSTSLAPIAPPAQPQPNRLAPPSPPPALTAAQPSLLYLQQRRLHQDLTYITHTA